MMMIELTALENGAHNNQTYTGTLPAGWAVIPDTMLPMMQNFPFGEPTAKEINGVMTVISWKPLPMPEVEEVAEEPSQLDRIEAQITYTAMMTDTLLGV